MKKIVLLLSLVASFAANAGYLYWQVESSAAEPWGANYAVLNQVGSGAVSSAAVGTVTSFEIAGKSGSFYVELFNYTDGVANSVAVGSTMSYSELAAMGAISDTLLEIPTAWTGGPYSVPEPTSAVLMLLGLAGLALKRRKA